MNNQHYFQFITSPIVKYGPTDGPRLDTSFVTGLAINLETKDPLLFTTNATSENLPPDFFSKMAIPVMSDKLITALRVSGVDNLQCFDAVLENLETEERWTGYKAVNIIGLVSCTDFSQSVYEEWGDGMCSFSELVIDPKKAGGKLFFRLAESPSIIIAHKSIGDYLYSDACPKMTGFRFWPTDAESLRKMRNSPLP